MTEVRNGESGWRGAPVPDCLFCHEPVRWGACWYGATDLSVCVRCVTEGKLGLLIGDAVDLSSQISGALVATEREAWRGLVLAQERHAKRMRGRRDLTTAQPL
jgi:hypothetical protein